ncbi:MAG: universal stress protein [Pyrinomonadaceae bacterium]
MSLEGFNRHKQGEPKRELIALADEWGADFIFVGAKGARGVEDLLS